MNKQGEPILVKCLIPQVYDSIEFSLATGITNYDLRENEASAFLNHDIYTVINIRTTKNLTARFNSDTAPAITLSNTRVFELNDLLEIKQIFLTNASGDSASIQIFATRKGVNNR